MCLTKLRYHQSIKYMCRVLMLNPPLMSGNAALTLRSRLRCIVMKKESQDSQVTKPATNLLVLNEVCKSKQQFILVISHVQGYQATCS